MAAPSPAVPAAAPAATDRESVILVQLAAALNRQRWIVVAGLVLGLLGALVFTLLTPPTYRASVRLQFEPQATNVVTLGNGRQAATRPAGDIMYDFTAVGLLRARSLADKVVRSENLANDPGLIDQSIAPDARFAIARGIVLGGIDVVQQRQARLVDVHFRHTDPARAAQIANAIARNFIQSNLEQGINQSAYARQFLNRRLSEVRQTLEQSERALVAFERAQGRVTIRPNAGNGEVAEAQSINNAQLADVATALSAATERRIQAEQRLRAARATPAARGEGKSAAIETELAQQRARLAELNVLYREDHPDVQAAEGRIRVLQDAVAQSSGSDLATLLSAYRAAQGEEQALSRRLATLRNAVLDERSSSVRYTILAREVDTTRALYNALLQRYREVGVENGIGPVQVSIVDAATVPGGPISPILPLNLAIGGAIGLFVGLLAAYGYDMLRDLVTGPHDVEQRLGLKALGAVPVEEEHDSIAVALESPRSAATEAYFAIANTLRLATDHGVPRSMVVTSTAEGEGKSSSSYGLARSLSSMGKSVLLVDADMRRPSLVGTADDRSRPGLADLLSGNAEVDETIVRGAGEMDVIFAGRTPPNPSELLAGARLRPLMEALSQRYDVVIFDAPPILGYVDAPVLASIAEATILIFESARNRVPHAQSSVRKLHAAGANIVGGVVTKLKRKNDQYGYAYGYYGKGYGHPDPDHPDHERFIHIGRTEPA